MTDGDQLSAVFPGTEVFVGNNATTLAAAVAGQGLLDTTSTGDVTAYTSVRGSPPASVPFVTVGYIPNTQTPEGTIPARLELWFHPQPQGVKENVFVTLNRPSVQVLDDLTGTPVFPVAKEIPIKTKDNIWTISWPGLARGPFPLYLRLVFSTEETPVDITSLPQVNSPAPGSPTSGPMKLADWIKLSGVRYVGWEGATIVSFARVTGQGIVNE